MNLEKQNNYKTNNRYNESINEKKNILLNISSQLSRSIEKKRNELNNKKNDSNKVFTSIDSINDSKRLRQIFLFNQKHRFNLGNKNKIGNNKDIANSNPKRINNINELEYEFEIILLKKKLKSLKNENKEKKEKLDKMRIINKSIEKIIEKQKALKNLILLFKNYIIYNNKNRLNEILKEKNFNNTFSDDALIFVIMDLKYDYENNLLHNEFFEGVNKLFITQLKSVNDKNDDSKDINIIQKIDKLIDLKNSLTNDINKYKSALKDNIKIYYYYTSLLSNLNLHSFSSLEKFIKKKYMENIEENYQMKKLKNTLMRNTSSSRSPSNKKENNLLLSCGELNNLKNKNSNTDLKKIFQKKYSDSRVKQIKKNIFIINRNNNNLNEKLISRTENLNKYNQNFFTKINNNENSQNLVLKKK
jgi:hypothetical protein